MKSSLNQQNKSYWQNYKPGEIPSIPQSLPEQLLKNVHGPILDVGTGDGVLAEELAQKGFDVYGIDIAQNIIEENKKRGSLVKYSTQDITQGTNFADSFFELVIFKFTLTNIHNESWENLRNEVSRITRSEARIWALEPLVSESYNERYKLASHFIKDTNCVFVFQTKELAEKIQTTRELQKAIDENKVSRVIKHYSVDELMSIFSNFALQDTRVLQIPSPSGFTMNTFEGVFTKSQ